MIGETFVIGNYVKLDHGVTLGARSFAKDESGQMIKENKRHPNVQDHVTIYPNSTILGGETVIGEDSTIGANVFLMQSVPANSLVIYEEKQLKVYDKTERTGKRRSPLECASCRWKLKVGIISASSITVFARPSPTTRRPSAHHSQPALWSFQWLAVTPKAPVRLKEVGCFKASLLSELCL